MTDPSRPRDQPVAPTWVVTLASGGADRGMVGPFPNAASAEAWAAEATRGDDRLSWRCDPVVAPATLAAAAERARRRHLHAVA